MQARATISALRREPGLVAALAATAVLAAGGVARLAADPPHDLRADVLAAAAGGLLAYAASGWARARVRRTAKGPFHILLADPRFARRWALALAAAAMTLAAGPVLGAMAVVHPAQAARMGLLLLGGAAGGLALHRVARHVQPSRAPPLAPASTKFLPGRSGRRTIESVYLRLTWLAASAGPPRAARLAGGLALVAAAGALAMRNNAAPDAGRAVVLFGCAALGAALCAPDLAVVRLLASTPVPLGRLWRVAALPGTAAVLAGAALAGAAAGLGAGATLAAAMAGALSTLVLASLAALHGVSRRPAAAGAAVTADVAGAILLLSLVGAPAALWPLLRLVMLAREARRRRWMAT